MTRPAGSPTASPPRPTRSTGDAAPDPAVSVLPRAPHRSARYWVITTLIVVVLMLRLVTNAALPQQACAHPVCENGPAPTNAPAAPQQAPPRP